MDDLGCFQLIIILPNAVAHIFMNSKSSYIYTQDNGLMYKQVFKSRTSWRLELNKYKNMNEL